MTGMPALQIYCITVTVNSFPSTEKLLMCRYCNAKLLVIIIVAQAKNSQGVEHYVMTGQPALQIDAFAYYFEM